MLVSLVWSFKPGIETQNQQLINGYAAKDQKKTNEPFGLNAFASAWSAAGSDRPESRWGWARRRVWEAETIKARRLTEQLML